jgi:hypothetical protein
MAKKKEEEQKAELEMFVFQEKIDAFKEHYIPCPTPSYNTEYFDEIKLRRFFQASLMFAGDPLTIYVQRLKEAGFKMVVGPMQEPVIYVTERPQGHSGMLQLEDVFGDGVNEATTDDMPEFEDDSHALDVFDDFTNNQNNADYEQSEVQNLEQRELHPE